MASERPLQDIGDGVGKGGGQFVRLLSSRVSPSAVVSLVSAKTRALVQCSVRWLALVTALLVSGLRVS